MSLASFYNRLEKKYRFFGEGPFTALFNYLEAKTKSWSEPQPEKQSPTEKLAAAYEARINAALAIENADAKYQALDEIHGDILSRRSDNKRHIDRLITVAAVIGALGIVGLGAGIGLAVGGAAWLALVVCEPAAAVFYLSSSDSDFLTYRVMKKNLCGERSEENKALKGLSKRVEQELAPIKAARAEAAKIKMEIIHLDSRGGIEIYTDKTVQVKPAAAFAEIGKDFNIVSAMNDTKVQQLADGNLVVYTDGVVKVKPAAPK